jgi:nucleotide-binding universal stress UspA family protein
MFEKVLVCLDGSSLAEQVLPYATETARRFGSKVALLQVITTSSAIATPIPAVEAVPVPVPLAAKQFEEEKERVEAYLNRVAQSLRERGLDVECLAVLGALPGETIVSYAGDNDVSLIAIATHGRSGLGRAVFGSVADFVLRESGLPTLVIKPQEIENRLPIEFQTFSKILVCLDGSRLAEQILPYAREEAVHFGSKVILLRAFDISTIPPTGRVGGTGIPEPSESMLEQVKEQIKIEENEAQNYLENVAERMRKRGLDVVCVTLSGAAGDVIIGYAQNEAVDLIALVTHGRSGLGRTIFGSVADHVLRESGLPLLVIKPQETETLYPI